ncbi:MAG TPA: hypothetical protein VFU41_02145 [Gemmatimonadales bacterium]|nr:hypothetical protein [Gemmatimonadales bacterium]
MDLDRPMVSLARQAQSPTAIIRRFETPERLLVFDRGRLEVITVGGKVFGKGSYEPGWRGSGSAKAALRGVHKPPEHVGVVLSGRAKLLINEDREIDLTPGDLFHLATEYECWVVGYRPCKVLYLSGVETLVDRLQKD